MRLPNVTKKMTPSKKDSPMLFNNRFDLRQQALKWLFILSATITGISPCLAQTGTSLDAEVAVQQPQPIATPVKRQSVVIDSIAAVVNKDVITVSELNDRTRVVINQLNAFFLFR